MKSLFPLVLIAVLISGCATSHSLPSTELRYGDAYLPPIHVLTDDPLKGGEIRNNLRATGMFSDVISGQPPADGYAVRVNVAQERDLPPFPVILLSAATLFLLPISDSMDSRLGFTLMKGGQTLKRYDYENKTQRYTWLLDRKEEATEENLRRITRAFAQDVQRDGLMPAVEAKP